MSDTYTSCARPQRLAVVALLLSSHCCSAYVLNGGHTTTRSYSAVARSKRLPHLPLVAAEASSEDDEACLIGTQEEEACEGKTGASAMTINLSKNIVGSGVLSLSAGVAAFSGTSSTLVPATALLILIGAVSAYCFSLIARVGEDNGTDTYRSTWAKLFGEKSGVIPDATIVFECMCAAVSFAIIIGDTFSSAASLCNAPAALCRPNTWIALHSLFVLLPICLLRDLGALAIGSVIGTAGTLYTAAFMLLRAADGSYRMGGRFFGALPAAGLPAFTSSAVGGRFSMCILLSLVANAFLAHYNAPTMYKQLAPPSDGSPKIRRFNRVVGGGFGLASALSALIMMAGFVTFGTTSSGLILNNYAVTDSLALVARLGIGLSIIFSYPLNFVGLREGVLSLLGASKHSGKTYVHVASTTLLLLSMNGLALVVKDLGALAAFSGAIVGSALIYIFPAAMFLKSAALARKRKASADADATPASCTTEKYSRLEVLANWLLAGLGVGLAVVGSAVAAKGW